MSATDVLARWESRRGELARLHAQVDGADLVEEFLSELEAMAADEQPVTLTRAAAVTGYSADHLSRPSNPANSRITAESTRQG